MSSFLQKVEDLVAQGETDVEKAFEIAWQDIKQFFAADVEPVMKAAFKYFQVNAVADAIKIGENAVGAFLFSGGNIEAAAPAILGTVIDEIKSAGMAIAEGEKTVVANTVVGLAQAAALQNAADAQKTAPVT